MADITHLFLRRHLRSGPTAWTRHSVGGRTRREGVGLSYAFRARTAVISEVPVEDRELSLVAHARTADRAAHRLRPVRQRRFQRGGRQQRPHRLLGQLPQQRGQRVERGGTPAVGAGVDAEVEPLCGQPRLHDPPRDPQRHADLGPVGTRLAGDERLAELGVAVVGVRVLAVRAAPELERALQTPTREAAQARADEATYRRRADAVEREHAIAENELQSSIELARREEQLVEQRGANTRRQAELGAAAETVAAEAAAARTRTTAAADADRMRALAGAEAERERTAAEIEAVRARDVGVAEAAGEAARVAALRDVPAEVLGALALRELAARLPEIGQLTITPDVLTGLVTRLTTPSGGPA
jgi:hypothetical protein